MSTLKVNAITDASGGNTATINSMTPTADSLQGFRNRIINGGMQIDQRNAGASVTVTTGVGTTYYLDRWVVYNNTNGTATIQRSTTAPTGFTNSLIYTVGTVDTSIAAGQFATIRQPIEGLNVSDLAWGTASAKSVTLSFWVRSSATGTFCASFFNSDGARSYVATYTISSADTWEYKTITIAGDTSGTWLTTNGIGLYVSFALCCGTDFQTTAGSWQTFSYAFGTSAQTNLFANSGATFYITGVQLEVGSTATPFERRPYGTELMLCQRYYFKTFNQATAPAQNAGTNTGEWCIPRVATGAITLRQSLSLPVVMRIAPSVITFFNPQAANAQARDADAGADCNSTTSLSFAQGDSKVTLYTITAAGGTIGNAIIVHITASAEL